MDGNSGYVFFEPDDANPPYIEHTRHGRLMWGYIGDPIVTEGTDEPTMIQMMELVGSNPWTGCVNTDMDDIGMSTGEFSSGRWNWTPDVETVGGSDCGKVWIENGHDPGVIPLPGGEFKVYYKYDDSGTENIYVKYWDGSDFVDESPIEFYWDGSGSGPTGDCVENVAPFVYAGATIHAGITRGCFSG